MHNLSEYILEKFRIGRDTEIKDDTFSVEELRKAAEVFVVCVRLASVNKLLEAM